MLPEVSLQHCLERKVFDRTILEESLYVTCDFTAKTMIQKYEKLGGRAEPRVTGSSC